MSYPFLLSLVVVNGCILSLAWAQLPAGWRADLQVDAQSYTPDSAINAPPVREKVLAQGFFNVLYSNEHLRLGFRYEAYFNPLLGIDPRYEGNGIPYRFIQYVGERFDVTIGNSYEQFGSGMILRTYEERSLGFDNSIDGIRLKARPIDGVQLTALFGKQRAFLGSVRVSSEQLTSTSSFTTWDGRISTCSNSPFPSNWALVLSPSSNQLQTQSSDCRKTSLPMRHAFH